MSEQVQTILYQGVMKILFIQLPLIDHGMGYLTGNVQYAPAALKAYISRHYPAQHQSGILPFHLSSFASDEVILARVKRESPDMILFSCYLWNIERHLYLAEKIKNEVPAARIIFGGPEISTGSVSLERHHPHVDYFVNGEGEWFLQKYIQGDSLEEYITPVSRNTCITQPSEELTPPGDITEPFLADELEVMPDGSIFLEMTRGCPYRCSYCYYSKNCTRVRELPFPLLTRAIESEKEISEIYILSPTFDASPDFIKRLETLKAMDHSISLHTELRASRITRETARLLFEAGFRSLEVGLQSLNPVSLEAVRRNSDPERELEGIMFLKEAGIDLKIGIIPGLPGETPETFRAVVDRLLELHLGDSVELYPLMILPGTSIREKAIKDKIAYMKEPPYFYLEGWGMNQEDIREASLYLEEATGLSQSSFTMPDFSFSEKSGNTLTSACFIDTGAEKVWQSADLTACIETSLFSYHLIRPLSRGLYRSLGKLLPELPPHTLFNVIFYETAPVDEKKLARCEKNDDSVFNRRLHLYLSDFEGSKVRYYHVTGDIQLYINLHNTYKRIEPLLQLTRENLSSVSRLIDQTEVIPPLIITSGMYAEAETLLEEHYREFPEMTAFENEREKERWYLRISMDHVDVPVKFTAVRL